MDLLDLEGESIDTLQDRNTANKMIQTESAPEWHFQNLTAAGIIPQPLTKRNYPGQCA